MKDRTRVVHAMVLVVITGLSLLTAFPHRAIGQDAQPAEKKGDEKKVLEVGKWYPELEAGLALTQGSFSDQWIGGEKGSIIWTLIANGTLESQMTPKTNLRNTLKLAFGQNHQQQMSSTGSRYWEAPEKSTDLIDFESLLRLTLGGYVDPFASLAFQSQFLDATDPKGRNLTFNPLQFRESAGIARKFIDTEERALLSRLGFTFRQNARKAFADTLTNRTSTETTNDGGIEWVTDYKSKILEKKVSWTSRLIVYQPVFYSGKDALDGLSPSFLADNGLDPDIASFTTRASADWENIWSTQITKILSVGLYFRWIYDVYDNTVKPLPSGSGAISNPQAIDSAVRKTGQFKETLSIGLTYRFL